MRIFNSILKTLILLVVVLVSLTSLTGCRAPKPQATPKPVPTPVPVLGSVVFTQSGHLVKMNLKDSQITPLTSGKSTEWFPVSSPNGGQVLYWSNAESGIYNLWKINMADSRRVQLTFNEESSLHSAEFNLLLNAGAAWTSDGKNIVYVQEGDIWEMDLDGYNSETLLSGHSALCASPSPDPDGKTVLYISNDQDVVYNLYVLNVSDKTVKKLTHYTDWNVGAPSFSPDGKKILFNLYRGDTTQIYTMNSDGSEPINLTSNAHSLCPRYGQGSAKIFYCSYGADDNTTLNVFTMNSNGTEVKQLTTEGGASPSWAPEQAAPVNPIPAAK